MTENIGVENRVLLTYYDENLPAMGAGKSIWVMSDNRSIFLCAIQNPHSLNCF